MSSPKKLKLDENPLPGGCQQFVERKKRWCRMSVAKGNQYCGEHSKERAINEDESETTVLRVPCPLDPKHSVFTDRLKQHLKVCNAREQAQPVFILKDINAGSEDENEAEEENETTRRTKKKLSDLDMHYLSGLVDKVRLFYASIKPEFEPREEINYDAHEDLEKDLTNPTFGPETLKHLKQTSALIGSMQRLDLLQPRSCFIEFGAGKGQVSYYLANSLQDTLDTAVLLIDRASMRFKMDNKCQDRSTIHRVRADIADLDLSAVPEVKGKERIVGISKHLCGAATDLAIRCMTGAREKQRDQQQALVIAVCCHHRCSWRSFAGKKEFRKHDLTSQDFLYIIKMVSWAVCGAGMSRERRKLIEDGGEADKEGPKLPWTKEEQEEIGYQCKRIIDHSRLQYLRGQGYTTGSFYYTSKDVTLENLCIYAKTPISCS